MALITVGTANGTAIERGATDDTTDTTLLRAAIALARSNIPAVPGSGIIRGVWVYDGVHYAFRDNAAATKCVMWESTESGWSEVSLGETMTFNSGGTYEVVEGNTITGASSGATATVKRVVLTSGTWAGGDAAGYFAVTDLIGNFIPSATLNVGANINVATVVNNHVETTLLPGGRYEFINENFYGSTATRRMYGCDGVNRAFEFDGTIFCPIATGMTTDTPIHISAHKKHLFLAFREGSVQHSSIGLPLEWDVITGSAELGTGDEITGFSAVPGGVLAIFNRNQTYLLYGTSVADWELKLHAEDSGAIEWSIQKIGSPRYLDDRGFTSLNAVQDFGDFAAATFSQKIQPLLDSKLRDTTVTASVRVRRKDQYRIFFADGTGIIAKFRGGNVEFTRVEYGKVIRCACSAEDSTGLEVLLFGADDGYVYEMDAGTSFDGEEVVAYMRLPFGHMKSPQIVKRYFKIVLEMDAPGGAALDFAQEYDYGNAGTPVGLTQALDVNSGGGFWGISEWSSFSWGNQTVGTAEGYLDGAGTNIGMYIRSAATYDAPHTINGVNFHYSLRGRAR